MNGPNARRAAIRLLLIGSICICIPAAGAAEMKRIASINLCTDQLLLLLADPEQIASVTFLARDAVASNTVREAERHHINHGQVEELIPLRPDVVVTLSFTAPSVRRLLEHLGIRVQLFEPAASLEDVADNIRRMAALTRRPERGKRLIAAMHDRLRAVGPPPEPDGSGPRGLIYEPNGYTSGAHTLRGELMRIAGWRNVATEVGIRGVGVVTLEPLVLAAPDRLIVSPYAPGTHSLGQRLMRHPALRRVTRRAPLAVPPRLWMCGGPMNVEAVAMLAAGR